VFSLTRGSDNTGGANMKSIVAGIVLALTAQGLGGQTAARVSPQTSPQTSAHVRLGIASDWTHHHVLFPDSKDEFARERGRTDPRWMQSWYIRHPESWWPAPFRGRRGRSRRDWSVPLSASPSTSAFEPLFDFAFTNAVDIGNGSLNTTDNGGGQFLATAGTVTVTAGRDVGSYPLYPGGPGVTSSPSGYFTYDDLLFPSADPGVDLQGLLFIGSGMEINIFSNGADDYEFYDDDGYNNVGDSFILTAAPGGGQTFPAKYAFDVTASPSCTNDFAVIGIPANPASGGQANIVGFNNLYSGTSTPTPFCGRSGPTVMFAYASGSGQVPASLVLAQNGSQIAYVENRVGSSYFHVLTLGTTGTNGTSPTAAVVPGSAGGNNAVDQSVLLSPDGGTTTQGSTNSAFVVYTHDDANDVAYVTTYSSAGSGSGYLYKVSNVFHGSAVPTLVWSVAIDAVPSTPVYDSVSNKVFFTDGSGRIDFVEDTGPSPSVVYGAVLAAGNTAENAVVVDSTDQMVYATFNSDGTNALLVQAPTSMASSVSVPVGTASTIYAGPYEPDFNYAWYSGTGTPLLYIAGTGTGTAPTLYSIGFNGSGVLNSSADPTTAVLATGTADSSPVTEFYNATLGTDYLFVGVTDHCVATIGGGNAGCVMSLNITSGFPTVNVSSTALAAPGGTSGIIVDNESSLNEASSIYYATKTGANLVKATQAGLN
jgi:hypothetical protein